MPYQTWATVKKKNAIYELYELGEDPWVLLQEFAGFVPLWYLQRQVKNAYEGMKANDNSSE